jgi:hypothetical protein
LENLEGKLKKKGELFINACIGKVHYIRNITFYWCAFGKHFQIGGNENVRTNAIASIFGQGCKIVWEENGDNG